MKWYRIRLTGYGANTEATLQISDGARMENGVMLQLWKDCGPIKFIVNPDGSITIPVEEIEKAEE